MSASSMLSIALVAIFLINVAFCLSLTRIFDRVHTTNAAAVSHLINTNNSLADQLRSLQSEVIKLNAELEKLMIENRALNIEVNQLSKEVQRLQKHVTQGIA